mmetsp:Transcript_102478/g.142779  ORF Transcript_102478/g.142779 Transcript_102478/m.142779 type:complete len:1178 (+) Transcript_102478:175-3708(+)
MRWPWIILLTAWSAVFCGGALSAWHFISKRGFKMAPQGLYRQELQSYSELFGNENGPQAAVMLSAAHPVMHFTKSSTCKLVPSMEPAGESSALRLTLSCENETAAGGGCITSSELRQEVTALVKSFLARQMSEADLSNFLLSQVQPMLDAAPDITACPHLNGQTLPSLAKVQATLEREMPQCKHSVLSFWSLPPQEFRGKLSIQAQEVDLVMKIPAGSFWNNFRELLSSKEGEKILVAVQTQSCNGVEVPDYSEETLQVAHILKRVANEIGSEHWKAEVLSFAMLVETISSGVEVVMAISAATLPAGLAVLAHMVGNVRLVIIATVNVLAAVTGSVLVMDLLVVRLMPVSLFTPPFLIAVVLAMSIDYSLFLLSRFQKEMQSNCDPSRSLSVAMATSGKIVAQAGITLCCCFCCLLMIPLPLVSAMGMGGLVAVCMAMMASMSLTPCLIMLWPSFWEPQRCWAWKRPGMWARFGLCLGKRARLLMGLTLILTVPLVWQDLRLPDNILGVVPALPSGASTTQLLQDMGDAFGYEAVFPTTLVLMSPEDVDLGEWRLRSCHALESIGQAVSESHPNFTASAFVGEIMIGGKCVTADVNSSQWSRGTSRSTILYVAYGLNPMSPEGQEWIRDFQKAVQTYQVGEWFVHGYGPRVASQAKALQERFPPLVATTIAVVFIISVLFTRSLVSTMRALFCLSWMVAALWALCSWVFPSGLYYVVPPMMLPFLVGVALDYDIFYVEAVLEHCRSGSTPKEASLSALNQTANTITAAGIIMIIAFVPLLLSSTLVMRQIGFMAVAGLVISSGWSTKVVAPLWLQMLDSCSFWPRSFQQDQNPVDVVFLSHPAYLVDWFTLFSSPTDTRWKPSWWMYAFLPLLWLVSFFTAHIFHRMGLLSHLVLDDFNYDGLRVQTWAVMHFGRHFRNRCELHDARRNVESAVRHADKQGVRYLGLGALNKAEFLNGGGRDLLEKLPARRMRISHGDHLTAAAVVETVVQLSYENSKIFMTGATSKTGRAVVLGLLRKGVRVLCHSTSLERRQDLERHGIRTTSELRDGESCELWIVGKYDVAVNKVMPPGATACVFAVPDPVSRTDIHVCEGATLHLDKERLEGRRANLKLAAHEIYACNAAALVFASKQGDDDEVDAIDPTTLDTYFREAKAMGFSLPKPRASPSLPDLPICRA